MRIEILVIGNEILIGKCQDTNSNWMAKRIAKYGHILSRITTIGDIEDDIAETIQSILHREPDIIITSGGLGPTFDDITMQSVAKGLNRKLTIDKHAYRLIKKGYEKAYDKGLLKLREMTKEREKMAYLPTNSTMLPNLVGAAPGVKIKEGNSIIYILPGVPTELKKMFREFIIPYLSKKKGKFLEKGFIIRDIGESQLAPFITSLEEKNPKLWIKTHPRTQYGVELELSITAFNLENASDTVDSILDEVRAIVASLGGKVIEK
ncbi:MAG: damage-inducible protein CinA [Candidatus Lokiarchaeota archaeon]|nr:damage-inducible protein CinA [Candidatus Lokiarchaeota archaeon]